MMSRETEQSSAPPHVARASTAGRPAAAVQLQRARVAWACFGAASAAAVVLIAIAASGTTFTGDEWGILFRLADRPFADAVFDPPAGKYLLVAPTLIYAALAELLGTDSYVPYRVTGMVLVVLAAGLFLEFARRRMGYGLALGGAVLLLFFGAASEVVAIPGRVPSQIAMCAGLGMLLALERNDRRGDVAACVLCALAVTSHPVGLAFLAAAVAWIALDDPARRWNRSWVALVPLALYALWYATLRDSIEVARPEFSDTVSFAWDTFVAVCGALTGVFRTPWTIHVDFINAWSTVVAIVSIVIGVAAIARTRRLTAGLVAALAALGVDLIGPAISHGGLENLFREPDAARYLYPGAIFVLLVAAELIGARPLETRFRRLVLGLATLVFLSALYSNVSYLVDRTGSLATGGDLIRAELGALELAREGDRGQLPRGSPAPEDSIRALSLLSGPLGAPAEQVVSAAPAYFLITDEFGSPASTRAQLERSASPFRERADLVLASAIPVELEPAGRAPAQREPGSCLKLDPSGAVPPGRYWVEGGRGTPPNLRLGRLAEEPTYPIEWPSRGRNASLLLPRAELGEVPWKLLAYPGGKTAVCPY